MKRQVINRGSVDYRELFRITRKILRFEIRHQKTKKIKQAIKENKKFTKARRNVMLELQILIPVKDKEGNAITEKYVKIC